MEYQFQNGPSEKLTTIALNEFELAIQSADAIKRIPYASITEVRLGCNKTSYFAHVITLDYGTIYLTNRSFQDNRWVDQSRSYHTFIRVLHLHLSSKSKASFYSGVNLNQEAIKLIVLLIAAALLFLGEEYFDWVPFSSIVLTSIFFIAGAAIIVIPNLSRWPKNYQPTEIPMDLLPPA